LFWKFGGEEKRGLWKDEIRGKNRETFSICPECLNGRVETCRGGRLILLKSVMSSLPVYALSFFKAPLCILSSIESILNIFFCEGVRIIGKLHGLIGILFV